MKITLLQATDLRICVKAARICYSSKSDNMGEKDKKLIQNIIKSGHESVIEHIVYTFKIEGISRVVSHQLVRHRMASYSQQSLRYTKPNDFYIPEIEDSNTKELIKELFDALNKTYLSLVEGGVKKETARYILPLAVTTNLIMTINARSLRNFFKLRLSKRAQPEMRHLAQLIFQALPPQHQEWLFFDIQGL